jgi:uroporphyrinogen-III decarboxylase
MNRQFYLDLAARGLRMPIGADLVLNEQPEPESVRRDGACLGRVLAETAARYRTPLAFPLMDLSLDKADLLAAFGIGEAEAESYQFREPPGALELAALDAHANQPFGPRHHAHIESVRYIAEHTALLPIGMAIGPFSLMSRLIADPITPLLLAGKGITPAEDAGVRMAEVCLEMAEKTVQRSVREQIRAGARAFLLCEPAANKVYISPRQMETGADTFERFVIQPNVRLKRLMEAGGADLIFHDCGELVPAMVREFATRLDPAILSLGSSRKLWEDAALVPDSVVLYGNLPTKSFYSDSAMPIEKVRQLSAELVAKMREAGHPFILGSECDVLHVPESAATIRQKVEAMLA